MPTIDADAHVIESDDTWKYIPDEKLRPFIISPGGGRPQNWLVDGRVFHRGVNFDRNLRIDICEMRDIQGRLKHMDELEIDVQVLYPSLFLRPLTRKAEVENALCRSYNQWVIDVCKKGEGRLEWIAQVPVIDIPSTVTEIEFARANGACGIFLRGMIDDKRLSNPAFFPIYAAAEKAATDAKAAAKAAEDAAKPGFVNLTILGDFDEEVVVSVSGNEVARTTGKTIGLERVSPGPTKIAARAKKGTKVLDVSTIIDVKPGLQDCKLTLS